MSALYDYTPIQNGNTKVILAPHGTPDHSEYSPPHWLGQAPTETPPPLPAPSLPTVQGGVSEKQCTGTSLNRLAERFRNESGHLAASTRQKFECHFKVAGEHMAFNRDVSSITLADLRQLKGKLSNGRKPSTVNDIIFKALGALFQMAVDDEIIDKSPLEKLKRAKKGEPDRQQPNWEQAQQIEIEVGRYASETAIIVGFMRNFGVGQAEIRFLCGEHVDCEKGMIHFRRKKTGKPFDVPIFPHAKAFIEDLKAKGRFQVGKPVVVWRNPRKALATACERLGLPSYEPRALRRCFIVHCLQQGIDPRLVAKWQGHKDAKLIFSVYGKFIDQNYEQAQAQRLGGLTAEVPADAAQVNQRAS